MSAWTLRRLYWTAILGFLVVGLLAATVATAVLSELPLLSGWLLAALFVLAGSLLQYELGGFFERLIVVGAKSPALKVVLAVIYFFRWALLGVPLFIAVFNRDDFSLSTVAPGILAAPLLAMLVAGIYF